MLTVIICTYNREDYIIDTLECIAQNDLPTTEYEILVVDNNCTDHTHERCMAFAAEHKEITFRYVIETQQGVSATRNRAIREAHGDIIVYLDDDELVKPNYLRSYLAFFQSHPDALAAGGPIEPHYETEEPAWMSRYTKALLTGWMDYGTALRTYPRGKFPGAGNSAYRKSVFDIVGLFNTALGRTGNNPMGGEEKDIFDKMRTANIPVYYIPEAVIYHRIPAQKLSDDYFNRLTYQMGRSERLRTRAIGQGKYLHRLFQETIKWGGTLALLCAYTLCGCPQKGWKLVLFRKNVTKGLLGG